MRRFFDGRKEKIWHIFTAQHIFKPNQKEKENKPILEQIEKSTKNLVGKEDRSKTKLHEVLNI